LVLDITYSWSVVSTSANIDAGVYFLGFGRGYDCNPQSMTYIPTFTSGSGATNSERFTVKLGQAFADLKWSTSTTVQLRAGWYNQADNGVATVTLSTTRVQTNGAIINDNNAISFGIDPPSSPALTCAPLVGTLTVGIGTDGKVTMTVPK
jgi:hypothetical protein